MEQIILSIYEAFLFGHSLHCSLSKKTCQLWPNMECKHYITWQPVYCSGLWYSVVQCGQGSVKLFSREVQGGAVW